MAKKYLDSDGLLYFWQKIKAKFNKTDIAYDSTNSKITKTVDGTTSDVVSAATLKTAMGLDGAEANQNAFSNIKVGSTTVAADSKTDTVEFVGSGVTITPDATNDKITFTVQGAAPATNTPAMNGTAAVGTSDKFAREDHVHPSDTSRVPTTRTVNGHALSSNVTVTNLDLGQTYGTCGTAEATAAKAVTMSSYLLTTGGIVSIKFTYAVPANATLNINSKGAKAIYYKGSAIAAGVIKAGDTATFIYNGSQYHLIAIDRSAEAEKNVVTSITQDSDGFVTIVRSDSTSFSNIITTSALSLMIGAASGVCPLNASSKIDSTYLPSYVDDVIEAYPRTGQTELSSGWLSLTSGGSALTGETGKIYVLMADSTNYSANDTFRYSGSTYVKLADGGVSAITNSEIDTILAS